VLVQLPRRGAPERPCRLLGLPGPGRLRRRPTHQLQKRMALSRMLAGQCSKV